MHGVAAPASSRVVEVTRACEAISAFSQHRALFGTVPSFGTAHPLVLFWSLALIILWALLPSVIYIHGIYTSPIHTYTRTHRL